MADERAFAGLRAVIVDAQVRVFGMVLRQAHLRPRLHRLPDDTVASRDVILERLVFEQIKLDELDPLVLEIHQRAIDAETVFQEVP